MRRAAKDEKTRKIIECWRAQYAHAQGMVVDIKQPTKEDRRKSADECSRFDYKKALE